MTIVFKEDTEFASDGVNPKTYKAGVAYSARFSHEKIWFRYYVDKGFAEKYDPDIHDRPQEQENKVLKPRGAKNTK